MWSFKKIFKILKRRAYVKSGIKSSEDQLAYNIIFFGLSPQLKQTKYL